MKVKFHAKIIIGSIFSFVSAIVGFIAIFFPDLFNLQKEKIEKYSSFIYSEDDAREFETFIHNNDGKIISIDIAYCTQNANDSNPIVKENNQLQYIFLKYCHNIDNSCVEPTINIGSKIDQDSHWRIALPDSKHNFEKCKVDDELNLYKGSQLYGTYMINIQNYNKLQYFIYFNPLTKQELLLKDY
ncbi:TPA: hypothetical protein ACPDTQ_000939 [Pasteurella multocida]|uniref:hypothetical protein n=1 Tax=Pasteurella multocida TaxID=747 RepID=UPI00061A8A47|nr:hypothetical protein [Pasteurella multocida]AKD39642.1 hypothetical protein I927_02025 [Pasteurella multocida OH1905]URJ90188.1 hypothetical protein M9415_05460 [Pasteurella multocida]WRK05927.1 hypothetical protein RFF10_04255 [Pasteurella multocida]HDR1788628.1 hypothetical protein [Pasteurella multocida]